MSDSKSQIIAEHEKTLDENWHYAYKQESVEKAIQELDKYNQGVFCLELNEKHYMVKQVMVHTYDSCWMYRAVKKAAKISLSNMENNIEFYFMSAELPANAFWDEETLTFRLIKWIIEEQKNEHQHYKLTALVGSFPELSKKQKKKHILSLCGRCAKAFPFSIN